jgi:starvation-inducible DNA-binding protein
MAATRTRTAAVRNGTGARRMFPTRNDLPERTRAEMIALCNQNLADISDLYSQTKQAHWNVRGPEFFQLHELFDQLAEGVEEYIDMVAERATALGGEALGTVRMAADASRLAEFPTTLRRGIQHVEALAERYGQTAANVREAIEISDKIGDMDTSDLFIEISRGLDKWLWFLEAHLQSE